MAESGLNDSKEVRNQIWNLSLSHEGILGPGLEQWLKERVEINKQISDLLPEMARKRRRTFSSYDRSNKKRHRFQNYSTQGYKHFNQPYPAMSRQQYRPSSTRSSYPRFSKSNTMKTSSSFRNKTVSSTQRLSRSIVQNSDSAIFHRSQIFDILSLSTLYFSNTI